MNNELQIFKSEEFGQVRLVMINNEPMFIGKDLVENLGYNIESVSYSKYIKQNCDEEDYRILKKSELDLFKITDCGRKGGYLVNESGMYSLVLGCDLPSAKKFKRWITHDVLPTIRKTVSVLESISYTGNINNLVYSKDGVAITTSKVIAEVTGKEHKHILRDIREEIDKLNNIHSPKLDYELIINDFKKVEYVAENGQTYTQYELGEMATMQLMLKYSTEFRAMFILSFQRMKQAINNMFKAKVIESVLPQDNRLRQYIYVIKNPLNETVKIGVANDVEKRMKQLQTGAGIELELIYKSMICSNAFSIEKDVHKHFEEYRTFGEWFKINPTVVINFLEQQTFVLKSEFMKYISLYDSNINQKLII